MRRVDAVLRARRLGLRGRARQRRQRGRAAGQRIEELAAREPALPRARPDAQLRPAQRAARRHPRRAHATSSSRSTTTSRTRPRRSRSCSRSSTPGFDVVYGSADEPGSSGSGATSATSITKLALRGAIGSEIGEQGERVPRVPHRPARRVRRATAAPYVSIDVLLSWGTTRFAAVPVRARRARRGAARATRSARLATHALNVMTGFSTRPLRIASLDRRRLHAVRRGRARGRRDPLRLVEGGSVPGFPFLASMIAIFSGAQLLTLGDHRRVPRAHARARDGSARLHGARGGRRGAREEVGAPGSSAPACSCRGTRSSGACASLASRAAR